MKSIDNMEYNPISEKLVEILCAKAQNSNPLFFRVMVGYYFCMLASMMRTVINTHDRGLIPVNMYAFNLSTSGSGKTLASNIMEDHVTNGFRDEFLQRTFPLMANVNLPILAVKRAERKDSDPDAELVKVEKEFNSLGELAFSFDSGSAPAIKQMRHKLLMADGGSLNLQIDEIGLHLVGNSEGLATFLELYDIGNIKQKLTKNTNDNVRNEEIKGSTPTNMLLFGTPSKLLNGGKTEDELYVMLDTGYARRCFFGYAKASTRSLEMTPEEIYDELTNTDSNAFLEEISDKFAQLADYVNANKKLSISKETSLTLIEYRQSCDRKAAEYPEHNEIKKAEMSHRYFKVLKLAGAYAFIDNSPEVTAEHLYQAIKLAEDSGRAFNALLTKDRPHVRLAKYFSAVGEDITQADLVQDLPYYRVPNAQKTEMLSLAIAYGYKNNIIIKKSYTDGVEFLRGETLKETNLDETIVSYSTQLASGYKGERVPFKQLHVLTQNDGYHWVNHHMKHEHRNEDNAIAGFNLIVLDVDHGVNISTAQLLLKKYTYLIHTTKRHTADEHRFRIIMPINYELLLDAKEFKEFMTNLYSWLPFGFEVDTSTGQRSRKWLAHNGEYAYNDGIMLDALPFIPKTSKNEERKQHLQSQQSMDNLERWVINNIGDGNRNNMLLRYGLILVDGNFTFEQIHTKVMELNEKIDDKLDEAEIVSTILVSVNKAIEKRE